MARQINDTQQFSDKLVKFIPTEIIGAYMVLAGFLGFGPGTNLNTSDHMQGILIQVVFFIFLVLTPVYLWKISNVTNKMQLLIATGSFAVWVYTLGGPFDVWNLYNSDISSVTLVIWSLIPPLLVQGEKPIDSPQSS